MSERTVCKHIRADKVVFNWALKEDAAKINPFDQVSGTEPVNDTQSPIITVAEAEAMLGVAGDYKAAIALLFYAGIRRGELFRIDWPHVELPTGKLTVVNHLGHETSKVKSRVVRIEPELASCLGWSRPDGRVIHKRIKDSTINDAIAKFAAEVGIERHITCQTFRRSRATLWRDTFPPHVVNKWMGHGERIAMRHYARVTDDYYTPSSGNTIRLSA
jgi:integrase